MSESIQIALLSRNELAREGLRRILLARDFQVCTSTADPTALEFDEPTENQPQIIIVDKTAGSDALESCRELTQRYPKARVVLLADNFEIEEVALAFGSGIDGYFVKEISCEPLIESLRLVALGEKVLPSQLASNLGAVSLGSVAEDWHENVAAAGLSEREVEILWCLTLGMANKMVSRRLNISEATVKVHVKAILRKLKVANRTQAAIWAVKHGFERHAESVEGIERHSESVEHPIQLVASNSQLLEYAANG
jgi:two-component system nitrate/nitrite response regulator NarL